MGCFSHFLFFVLQRLSHDFGWGYRDVVDRLEEKRKIKAKAYHERKVWTGKTSPLKIDTNMVSIS